MNKRISALFKGDKVIWMVFFFLVVISILEVYSASSELTFKSGDYISPMRKHMGLMLVGVVMMIVTLNIECRYFKLAIPFLGLIAGLSLLFVFAVGLFSHGGNSVNGASRWINLGLFQFQPSELAKGTLVLITAQILSSLQTKNGIDKIAFRYITIITVPTVLLIFFENLSTAFLLSLTILLMMIIGRVPARQWMKLVAAVAIGGVVAIACIFAFGDSEAAKAEKEAATVTMTETVADGNTTVKTTKRHGVLHRLDTWKARIEKFANGKDVRPDEVDIKDKDAQVAFANIAIASSGFWGKGIGNSVERDFLPQAFSDYIYAIIIEEMGMLGAMFVAFLYVVLLFRTGRIAKRCENSFPAFLAMGLALLLVVQAMFNMCVAVGILPVTGQPLPLLSKGGTSSIINCIYVGVILSVSRTSRKNAMPVDKGDGAENVAVAAQTAK